MKNVKNLLILVLCVFASFNTYAQISPVQKIGGQEMAIQGPWQTNVNDKSCFCCGEFYSLPAAIVIDGPTSLACGDKPKYCIKLCPGAAISWSASAPNSISGSNTGTCITLNPTTGTSVTITVTISCQGKKTQKQIVVPIKQIPNCTSLFQVNLIELPNNYQVQASQSPPPNTMHYWVLQEVASCPSGATVNSVGSLWINPPSVPWPSIPGITAGPTGFGFYYSGLVKGKCYRLYHYVYCCGKWQVSYRCFCPPPAGSKMSTSAISAMNENAVTKDVSVEELPAELKSRLNSGNK